MFLVWNMVFKLSHNWSESSVVWDRWSVLSEILVKRSISRRRTSKCAVEITSSSILSWSILNFHTWNCLDTECFTLFKLCNLVHWDSSISTAMSCSIECLSSVDHLQLISWDGGASYWKNSLLVWIVVLGDSVVAMVSEVWRLLLHHISVVVDVLLLDWVDGLKHVLVNVLSARNSCLRSTVDPSLVEVKLIH